MGLVYSITHRHRIRLPLDWWPTHLRNHCLTKTCKFLEACKGCGLPWRYASSLTFRKSPLLPCHLPLLGSQWRVFFWLLYWSPVFFSVLISSYYHWEFLMFFLSLSFWNRFYIFSFSDSSTLPSARSLPTCLKIFLLLIKHSLITFITYFSLFSPHSFLPCVLIFPQREASCFSPISRIHVRENSKSMYGIGSLDDVISCHLGSFVGLFLVSACVENKAIQNYMYNKA